MENYKEVNGTYGRGKTPTIIFVCETHKGNWYCAEGSKNVNRTYNKIEEGVNIEELSDFDMFTASKEINSIEELEAAIND